MRAFASTSTHSGKPRPSCASAAALIESQRPDVVAVSESGLHTRMDLERLRGDGYHAFLIGERFMLDPDPARAIGELIGVPA